MPLGRKAMTNLDSILKSRDITSPTKVHLVKAMVFPVVMYGCESWTIKKAEHRRIDAFKLWCWRRLLRVPWTARRSNQSILKEITLNVHWKDCCWSWSSNTLATWWEKLTHWKRPWCLERLKAGGKGDDRGWDGWIAAPIQWTGVWATGRWWRTGKPGFEGAHRQTECSETQEASLAILSCGPPGTWGQTRTFFFPLLHKRIRVLFLVGI